MTYAFYPGCSLEVNAAAYDVSVKAVCRHLGVTLKELDDWNCCGATEYSSQDELTACVPRHGESRPRRIPLARLYRV